MEKDKRIEEIALLTRILTLASDEETGAAADAIFEKFGSFSAIFDARISDLQKLPAIGHNTALFLKLLPEITRRSLIDKYPLPKRYDQAGFDSYLTAFYFGRMTESLLVFAVGADGKILTHTELVGQPGNTILINLRRLVEFAVNSGAATVILAHNHPGGFAVPSPDDYDATKRLLKALEAVDVSLTDHLIVADDDYVSMAQSGSLEYIKQRNKPRN